MVVIRLARGGAKHRPFYSIVVADRRNARDGRFIEKLGFHNPLANDRQEETRINEERLEYWLSKGAQMSMTVRRLCRQSGIKFASPNKLAPRPEAEEAKGSDEA